MNWNYDGSILAVVGKDSEIEIFDPRVVGGAVVKHKVHAGSKS